LQQIGRVAANRTQKAAHAAHRAGLGSIRLFGRHFELFYEFYNMFCGDCGTESASNANYCHSCGSKFLNPTIAATTVLSSVPSASKLPVNPLTNFEEFQKSKSLQRRSNFVPNKHTKKQKLSAPAVIQDATVQIGFMVEKEGNLSIKQLQCVQK
jgi:hypothetical protein